ncbi:unnamed protein product, partial [Phaeothamnion confervicola]
ALISNEAGDQLRSYQYRGRDLSLAYKHFLSPLAERCLVVTPQSMAPNLITFLGLLISMASSCVFWYVCPDWVSVDAPRWVFPLMGASLFIYQTLDNMDGKQARRTSTGSALGLLFDHGCDAINATFGAFILIAIVSAGRSLPVVAACYGNNAFPFFFATWEHYYTHELVLPVINGPSEGVLIGVLLSVLTYFVGPAFWAQPVPLPLPPVAAAFIVRVAGPASLAPPMWTIFMAGSYVGIIATVAIQMTNVLRLRRKQGLSLLTPLRDCTGFALIWVVAGQWLMTHPELFWRHPGCCLFLVGALNTEANVALMLAHMTEQTFRPFRPALLPLLLGWANSCLLPAPAVDEDSLLVMLAVLMQVLVGGYIVKMVLEMRDHLNIYVFSTQKRKLQ